MASRENSKDLVALYKTLFIELPLAGPKSLLGVAKEGEVEGHAWNGYDAWIRLIKQSTDSLYQNPFFGEALGRSMPGLLSVERLTRAISGAAFASMRSISGLAGAAEVHAIRTELRDLRRELRSVVAERSVASEQVAAERDYQAEEDFIKALDGRLHAVTNGNNHVSKAA